MALKHCDAKELHEVMKDGQSIQIVDVREMPEYAADRISASANVPLSQLKSHADRVSRERPIFLVCESDSRANQAGRKFEAMGFNDLTVLKGGLNSWRKESYPLETGQAAVWAMDRQVRFTAGLVILWGIIFSYLIHPLFVLISIFIGAGLVFSAVTDWCGMAILLGKMPWNRVQNNQTA